MLFNSYIFILMFLPITLSVYYMFNYLNKFKIANGCLIIASFIFYGYNNPSYLIIIISSIIINYITGIIILRKNDWQKKSLFIIGCIFNILLIGYFKYYNFFLENINYLLRKDFNIINIALPLGISFFTFQQISFLVDCYKHKIKVYKFLEYTLFVCFFPQLVAGPIVLPNEIMPQIEDTDNRKINYENIAKGIYILSIGLFKKVIIADTISKICNLGFENISILNFFEAWLVILSYTLQLYFDFSGYCDMASGIALLFNIKLPINFNSPYKAINIQDFWKRWHITLSRFLTNYIYIPLGGNKGPKLKTYRNILIVFLISGIWHGAGWTFIIWGLLHGVAMIIQRIFKYTSININKNLSWCMTFIFINLSWVFFRSPNIDVAIHMLNKLLIVDINPIMSILENGIGKESIIQHFKFIDMMRYNMSFTTVIFMFIIALICIFLPNSNTLKCKFKGANSELLLCITIFIIVMLNLGNISEFLYFNF